ncbi:hypothetical protein GLA29479_4481 [Lysobacter antibioticus]|nr:hypothetical protein GLA29479_4481 [Lysobacter antibioticus]
MAAEQELGLIGQRGATYFAPIGDGFAALRCRLRLCRSDVSRDRECAETARPSSFIEAALA